MGDLIVMSRPKPFRAREFSASHSAEILFFTGVRYYRMDDAVEPANLVTANLVTANLVTAKVVAGKRGVAKRRRPSEPRTTSNRLRDERLQEALA